MMSYGIANQNGSAYSDSNLARTRLLGPRRSFRRAARRCNSSHDDQPLISVLIQSFREGDNAKQLSSRLHLLPRVEVIVNDDSGSDHAKWLRHLNGPNDFVVSSPNIHEIRAYNRLARLARGEFLLLLQGDHCLPPQATWLRAGLDVMRAFPRLAMLGGQLGYNGVPFKHVAESISWGTAPARPIPSRIPSSFGASIGGMALKFVAGVNIGPLLIRREAFLQAGGFDESFSCAAEPGIQLDTELSLQFWSMGYQVAMWYSAVSNGVGGRRATTGTHKKLYTKTRSNKAQKRIRARNDQLNGRRCERLLLKHDAEAVTAANRMLEPVADAAAMRQRELQQRGMREPARCAEAADAESARGG